MVDFVCIWFRRRANLQYFDWRIRRRFKILNFSEKQNAASSDTAFGIKPAFVCKLSLHRRKEFCVGLGLTEAFEHDFHLFDRRKWIKYTSHDPDTVKVFLAYQ